MSKTLPYRSKSGKRSSAVVPAAVIHRGRQYAVFGRGRCAREGEANKGWVGEGRCLRKETLRTRREKDSRFSGCPERPKRDIAIDGGGVFLFIYLIAAWGFLLGFGTAWEDQGKKKRIPRKFILAYI